MHNAPPVSYPVGRCALCAKAFYWVWLVQTAVLVVVAFVSNQLNSPMAQLWPWMFAGVVWVLWLLWAFRTDWRAKRRADSWATPSSEQYLMWQSTHEPASWQLYMKAYEPVQLLNLRVVLDAGFCMLVRATPSETNAAKWRLREHRWLWVFEQDSPQRWAALRRALLGV